MGQPEFTSLRDSLKSAAPFRIQVLSAADLDLVSGGFDVEDSFNGDCSCTVSQCSNDGNMESGSS
jgi:hypothetical protein